MARKIILETICFVFILLFTYAALAKLFDYERFKIQISQSPLLTDLATLVAWFIPGLELVIAIMLMLQRLRHIALYSAFSLMVSFTAYIIAILNFSTDIPCSCGGVFEKLGWSEHLVFNISLTALALAGIWLHSNTNYSSTSKVTVPL
jgi:uncharacterized membrane protein YphA (DoxX/SURF4 family)